MNQREAKATACFHAALILQSALDNGWDPEEVAALGKEDSDRVYAGMGDLFAELWRRGRRAEKASAAWAQWRRRVYAP